jgi:RNA polymerase-binding transcription factor DksA
VWFVTAVATTEERRAALLAERDAVRARLAGLSDDFAVIVDASDMVATDDEHDPEGATIAFERAQVAALRDQARRHLADVDGALARLVAGTYGACEQCGRAIAEERLVARPAAATCIGCASAR